MIKFYDTSALLNGLYLKEPQTFFISSITLKQLQNIKTNALKDVQVKTKAKKLSLWLLNNKDKYSVYNYTKNITINNDSKIIESALIIKEQKEDDVLFISCDLNCLLLADAAGLKTYYPKSIQDQYTGYKIIESPSDDELANFYSSFGDKTCNFYNLLPNEYVILKDKDTVLDVQRFLGVDKGYTSISDVPFDSKMLGKIKAKDVYQRIAMDSLLNNKITAIRGSAGTGKSLLSLGYLFDRLEKNKIDKIIIFCNTVATQGSAKLGYYPGQRDQKLLDSQIGNFLLSKLGGKIAIQQLIDQNRLLLLPMSDIRGFDTTGMKAGIYITQAQNMNIDLMKLAIQRVGEDSILILDGDSKAQVDLDLYAGNNNGLKRVSQVFRGEDVYGQSTLVKIYRSKIAAIAECM